jgi:hypothetical protein
LLAGTLWLTALVVFAGHALAWRGWWRRPLAVLPSPLRGFGYALALSLALVLNPGADKAFIYFQF